jgi:hypothetical protein
MWYWGTRCRYKSEGCGFDFRWCHWNFSLTQSLGLTQSLTEKRGKGGRCVGSKTLPPLFADCLEIWDPQPPGTLRACPGL